MDQKCLLSCDPWLLGNKAINEHISKMCQSMVYPSSISQCFVGLFDFVAIKVPKVSHNQGHAQFKLKSPSISKSTIGRLSPGK
jgi:hypothetical protein